MLKLPGGGRQRPGHWSFHTLAGRLYSLVGSCRTLCPGGAALSQVSQYS